MSFCVFCSGGGRAYGEECNACAGTGHCSGAYHKDILEQDSNYVELQKRAQKRLSIYEEIDRERASQDSKWGGSQHDDQHTFRDWCSFVVRILGEAQALGEKGRSPLEFEEYRAKIIQVAALAVADIESLDRQVEVALFLKNNPHTHIIGAGMFGHNPEVQHNPYHNDNDPED